MKNLDFYNAIIKLQRDELFEKEVYLHIAKFIKDDKDRETLIRIANSEVEHYEIWKKYTKVDVKPSKIKVYIYTFFAWLLGYTFVIKIMEKIQGGFNEIIVKKFFTEINENIPNIDKILKDEEEHEEKLIQMIDEEKLQYVGSMVLGLNDALVEFTGSLAGWTFAMQSNKLILLAGIITGISATLSMASSEYLSAKNEGEENPLKSAIYTGIAYIITVVILLIPYAILPNEYFIHSLIIMLLFVIIIIAAFNFYISVAKDLNFKEKFKEMSLISLSVASVSFIIGILVKKFIGIDI
ncbi:MAG: VIT1/CCC1 transporter family protein [Fusobacteriaceae bacterium]|nr:VIT1/CCC1 transporter family protein [Fusobacteriaceae bacterium]MBP6466578.1 VIT1/CCC1 transporter family protein [Fusobacteriaceae bacterium]MBP9595409.1 VIT1/CCC1 transporter family protein [Fusobacteriaceae bacterium]MBU9918481.1 VIT1/CCC1 transporter family protein [Fusobacteriaceae bacterium]